MINREPILKIIDFGLSIYVDSNKLYPRHCGTPTYMAPELNLDEK